MPGVVGLLFYTQFLFSVPVPKIDMGENLIEAWRAIASGGQAVSELIELQFGTAPAAAFKDGAVALPVNFADTTFEHASWNLKVDVDLTKSKGISFDFFCDEQCFFGSNQELKSHLRPQAG